tara:strand:+ start:566 stop:745 length:180 start_codon:yes stop_codon:yes gene_type:complete
MEKQFNEDLLKVLVCPQTRTRLKYDPDKNELISESAGLAYRITDGVPILLIDEARKISS